MVKRESRKIEELKHKARRANIKEGILSSVKSSLGETYFSPFAIAINASNPIIALISSIDGLLGPLSQIFGSNLMEKYSRKKILLFSILFESLMFIPLIIIAFLFYKGILINFLPLFFLFAFAFFVIFSNLGYPSWFSWTGDIVDKKYLGKWFSKRTLILGVISMIFAVSSSIFLDYLKKRELLLLGFVIIFLIAFLIKLSCLRIIKKQYEPKIKIRKKDHFSFSDFVLKAHKTNMGRFAIFRALLGFACSISASVFVIYIFRTLGLTYLEYMVLIFIETFYSLIFINLLGKISDDYGNYKIMSLACILIPTIPIFWILIPSFIYLVLIPPIISGVSWAGFNLASRNFIYDNVKVEKRGIFVSYFNMLNGIGIFLGALIGATLIKFLPEIYSTKPIIIIFLISAIIRMAVVFFGITKIKETQKIKKLKDFKQLEKILVKEAKPTLSEEIHEVMTIKKYLRA